MLLVNIQYSILRKKKELLDVALDRNASGRRVSFSLNSALPALSYFSSFVITQCCAGIAGLRNLQKLQVAENAASMRCRVMCERSAPLDQAAAAEANLTLCPGLVSGRAVMFCTKNHSAVCRALFYSPMALHNRARGEKCTLEGEECVCSPPLARLWAVKGGDSICNVTTACSEAGNFNCARGMQILQTRNKCCDISVIVF